VRPRFFLARLFTDRPFPGRHGRDNPLRVVARPAMPPRKTALLLSDA
jgi:hypothetical protein